MFVVLGAEKAAEVICLFCCHPLVKRHKKIWRGEVAVIFGNFIFENQMVSKGVPSQIGNEAMVLVTVIPKMRENQVWSNVGLQGFKKVLDQGALEWKVAVSEIFCDDVRFGRIAQEHAGALFGFEIARLIGGKNNPPHRKAGQLTGQADDGTTAADFDVIAVGSQTEHIFNALQWQVFHGFAMGLSLLWSVPWALRESTEHWVWARRIARPSCGCGPFVQ